MGWACSTHGKKDKYLTGSRFGKLEGERPRVTHKYIWKHKIKTDFQETSWKGMDWISLT
jgi:hypothetical protein